MIGADGTLRTKKVSSTPDDYVRALTEGLTEILKETDLTCSAVAEIVHGTTVATNAILEHKGARTGLITTKGFRDILEIRRLRMPRLYDMSWRKPEPLVDRHLRLEVDERVDHRGSIVKPLESREVRQVISELLAEDVESVAVCLIHSYANDSHEREIGKQLGEMAPRLSCSLSCDVLPEIKEYERTSTTVINAYVRPVIAGYLDKMAVELRGMGVKAPVLVMQSNGGVASRLRAMEKPIHIIESGPAAGVIASAALARRMELPNAITLDMGGTTAKASIIEGGELNWSSEYEVGGELSLISRLQRGGGYVLRVPTIDIAEVGAGGGSIVWVDGGGGLRVGPRSAGAQPGPCCYGRGGEEPTLTDANVLLGYLNPHYLVGGDLTLDRERAYDAMAQRVAAPLGLDTYGAAYGVHEIASSTMARAVRAVSLERGRDPRDFKLIAFGGCGPLHAAVMAGPLGITDILVPPWPGLFSAHGLLLGDIEHHYLRTYLRRVDEVDADELAGILTEMEKEALSALRQEGYEPDQVAIRRSADLRYVGQSFELMLLVPGGEMSAESISALEEQFANEHERAYGHRAPGDPIELVSLRLVARAVTHRPEFGSEDPSHRVRVEGGSLSTGEVRHCRRAYFGRNTGFLYTPVLARQDLAAGALEGPLIIEEYDATTVVPPGWRAALDDWGNVRITLGGQRQ
jgi:N-methylhydantoinase A